MGARQATNKIKKEQNMCNKNKSKYYKLMGCVTLVIMVAMLIGLVITVISQFTDKAGAWPIIATFLNMVATLTLGSGLANLFYSQGISFEDKTDDTCDFD